MVCGWSDSFSNSGYKIVISSVLLILVICDFIRVLFPHLLVTMFKLYLKNVNFNSVDEYLGGA